MNSANNLIKYKKILKQLNKTFPKGQTNWMGFTIDVSYGGNKTPDIERLSLGGVASEKELGDQFLKLLLRSTKNNIVFWEKAVQKDIKDLQRALNYLEMEDLLKKTDFERDIFPDATHMLVTRNIKYDPETKTHSPGNIIQRYYFDSKGLEIGYKKEGKAAVIHREGRSWPAVLKSKFEQIDFEWKLD